MKKFVILVVFCCLLPEICLAEPNVQACTSAIPCQKTTGVWLSNQKALEISDARAKSSDMPLLVGGLVAGLLAGFLAGLAAGSRQ